MISKKLLDPIFLSRLFNNEDFINKGIILKVIPRLKRQKIDIDGDKVLFLKIDGIDSEGGRGAWHE